MRANLLTILWTLAACAPGDVVLTAYGEPFVEQGIPADAMADGWEIRFSRFEATLGAIEVGDARLDGPVRRDLALDSDGAGHRLGRRAVTAGDHESPGYTLSALHVVGTASQNNADVVFDWVFDAPTSYVDCDTTVVVPANGVGSFEITLHADHLFYDSLVDDDPALRFDALAAADLDQDGAITQDELSTVDIGLYDRGNADVNDLAAWLEAQVRTVGHADGEHHCRIANAL